MSLSKDEWDEIIGRFGAVVKLEISEALKQPCQDIRDLSVTVFGVNKDNGMFGEQKKSRTRMRRLELIVATAQGAWIAFTYWLSTK
jgi:hypothetical protein